jgi:hypothetical protein
MDTSEQTQLRTWLAKRLKRSDVPDSLWTTLIDDHHVAEVLQGYSSREELLEKARDMVSRSHKIAADFGGSASPLRSDTSETFTALNQSQNPNGPSLSDDELKRASAFSEYLAKAAEGEPAIQNFRRRILGVETLTQEQAQNLVSDPALGFLSPGWFLIHHIPLLDNQIRILDEESRRDPKIPNLVELIVRVELPDGRTETEDIVSMTNLQPAILTLPYGSELPSREVPVWPSSVLGILRKLSVALAGHYTWQEEDAAWFVLTGEEPMVSPLSWSTSRYGERDFKHWVINLNVAPWISTETLANYYRYLQRSRLGRNNRPLSERNVAVFRFVIAHLEAQPDKVDAALAWKGVPTSIISRARPSVLGSPTWRTMLERWNRAHPEWEYTDVRLFSRDFYRAHKAISQPYPR